MPRVKRICLISCQMLQFPSSPPNIIDPRQICIIHNIWLEIRGKWLLLFFFFNFILKSQHSGAKFRQKIFIPVFFLPVQVWCELQAVPDGC